MSRPRRHLSDRRGGTVIEYALIVALITIGLVGAITAWGDSAENRFALAEKAFK